MKYLKTYKKLNENYNFSYSDVFKNLDGIFRIIFFDDKPKKFFSIVYWNTKNGMISGELKLGYANDENYDILKQIWKCIEQNGDFKISPLTDRRLGWYLNIPEEKLSKIFENLKELTNNYVALTNIGYGIRMLKEIEIRKQASKYNL